MGFQQRERQRWRPLVERGMQEDRLLDIAVRGQHGFVVNGRSGDVGQCQILKGLVSQIEVLGFSCRQCGDIRGF